MAINLKDGSFSYQFNIEADELRNQFQYYDMTITLYTTGEKNFIDRIFVRISIKEKESDKLISVPYIWVIKYDYQIMKFEKSLLVECRLNEIPHKTVDEINEYLMNFQIHIRGKLFKLPTTESEFEKLIENLNK